MTFQFGAATENRDSSGSFLRLLSYVDLKQLTPSQKVTIVTQMRVIIIDDMH